jgi:hypothetical protein
LLTISSKKAFQRIIQKFSEHWQLQSVQRYLDANEERDDSDEVEDFVLS